MGLEGRKGGVQKNVDDLVEEREQGQELFIIRPLQFNSTPDRFLLSFFPSKSIYRLKSYRGGGERLKSVGANSKVPNSFGSDAPTSHGCDCSVTDCILEQFVEASLDTLLMTGYRVES